MAKYLLLKHYRGGPAPRYDVPMDRWTPDEVSAHMRFMHDFATRLEGLIENPSRAEHMGVMAHERVRADFLGNAHLIRWVHLFTDLLG